MSHDHFSQRSVDCRRRRSTALALEALERRAVPAVVVTPTSATVKEGESIQLSFRLTTRPTASVSFPLQSSNSAEATVSQQSLTFTRVNWATPQLVVLSGVQDFRLDGDKDLTVVTGKTSSKDPNYANKSVPDIQVTSVDSRVTPVVPPGPPTSVAGVPEPSGVRVTWVSPASDGGAVISDYDIQYSPNGGSSWFLFNDGLGSSTSAFVTGLTGGTYVFRVRASNSAGRGEFSFPSSPVLVRTTAGPPTNLVASAQGGTVTLSWTAPQSDGASPISDYGVRMSADGGMTWSRILDPVSTSTTTTVAVSGNGLRQFRVFAVTQAGNGIPSDPVSVSLVESVPSVAFDAVTTRGGDLFSYKIRATDNPTRYNATSLPDGLQLDPVRGIIAGFAPLEETVYFIGLEATNSAGTGRATLALSVQGVAVPVIVSPLAATAKIGKPFSYTIAAKGNPTLFSADGLPPGLAIDGSTGLISGVITSATSPSFNVRISARNAEGRQGSAKLILSVTSGEQEAIADYIRQFQPIAVPEPAFAVPTGPAVTTNEGAWENRVSVTRQPARDTQVFDKIVAFDPNVTALYAGAIVQGKDLPNGILNDINTDRNPVQLTVTGLNVPAGTRVTASVQPTLGFYTAAIFSDLLAQPVIPQQPARAAFTLRSVSSVEEGLLKLGASARWIGGSVKGSFVKSTSFQTNAVMVRYTQNYLQVSADAPVNPGAYFGADARLADIREKFGDPTTSGNPPAYVSSISYGRELWMLVESTSSSESMQTNLTAAFNALAASGRLDVSSEQSTALKTYSYQVFVLGGGGEAAAKVITTGIQGVADFVNAGANFSPQSPGAPISYTLRYLKSGDLARVSATTDYTIVTSQPNPQLVMLQSATWYFQTNNDDKDQGNSLTLTLVNKSGQVVATRSGVGLRAVWRDQTIQSPEGVNLTGITISKQSMIGGKILTSMGGNDGGWNFQCTIELVWTDGTKTTATISPRRWNDSGSTENPIS